MQRTLVELVTCFSAPEGPTTLALAPEVAYNDLVRRLAASDGGLQYGQIAPPGTMAVLGQLFCPDWEGAFWGSYLGDINRDNYPGYAWAHFLPIGSRLRRKLFVRNPPAGLKVTPQPVVWIFPSGCALSISLMVTGQHNLVELASLVQGISSGALPFCWENGPADITLADLRKELAACLKTDILAEKTSWRQYKSYVMTTVLDSGRKQMYRYEAIGHPLVDAIEQIVKPSGPPFTLTDEMMLHPKDEEDGEVNFIASSEFSFFIWLQEMLLSNNPHAATKLRRYHDNTVRSLLILWQQRTLLDGIVSSGRKPLDADRAALTQFAITRLSTTVGGYGNRTLRVVRDAGLTQLLAAATAAMSRT